MSELIRNLPNYLTYLRIILIPVFVLLLIDPSPFMVILANFVFIFAAFTDYIDGFLARRWGAVSDFGKLLDPIADKILVMAALVMLTSLHWVPGWMVVLVLAREIWITGIRALAASQGNIIAAGNTGKWKSFLQMFSIVLLLAHDYKISFFGKELSGYSLGIDLLSISLVLSYFSAIHYTVQVLGIKVSTSLGKSQNN
jgi:CDP-diacylglycerol---glycerol-3-phosphate 3-phosphatidyltransferase